MTTIPMKRRTPWLDSEPTSVSSPVSGEPSSSLPMDCTFHDSLLQAAKRQSNPALRLEPSVHAPITATSLETSSQAIAELTTNSPRPLIMGDQAKRDGESAALPKPDLATKVLTSKDTASDQRKLKRKGALAQILSWAQSRCKITTTKRLRVDEITSFGDKRFIALVSVGDREFLIGGGASGVSMLTPLQPCPDSTLTLTRPIGDSGSTR